MSDEIPSWAQGDVAPPPTTDIPTWAQGNEPQTDAQFWHQAGTPEQGYTYGDFFPIKKNNATGEHTLTSVGSVARGIGDLFDMAQNQSTEMTPDSVSATAALLTVPAMLESGVNAVSKSMANKTPRAGFWESQSSDPFAPPSVTPYTPEQYQAGISKSYAAAKASRAPFYDFMNQSANGQTIDVTPALEPAKKIISEIQSDPFHPARPALGRLQNFVDTYGENPQMPLADAVEMKQDINAYFNPKKFKQGSKSPYFQIGNALDSQIDAAAEANPIFGRAKELADQNHVNNVALPFTQNKLMEPFWKPQDYYAQSSVDNGLANYLPDETQQRASQMISNIKTPEQLNAVTRVMPPDMAAAFRADVLKNTTSGSGMYRLNELGEAVGDPFKSPKHVFNAIRGQTYNDTEKALISASKQESPSLTTQELQNQLGALKASPGAQQPPLALTYQPQIPEPEMLGGAQPPRQATNRELAQAQLGRQRMAKMGMYPAAGVPTPENIAPAVAAASQGQSPMLRQYGSAKMLGNEKIPPIPDKTGNPGAMGNASLINAQKSQNELSQWQQAQKTVDMQNAPQIQELPAPQQALPPQKQGLPYKDWQTEAQKVINKARAQGKPLNNPAIAQELAQALSQPFSTAAKKP